MATQTEREADLRTRFGDVLTLTDLAVVLRYSSVGAIRKSNSRGQLPVQLVKMTGRRGWFATAEAVAEYLASLEEARKQSNQPD
ncbi:hypothetical protein [Rhodanobacter lindaniclasticus]|uniref:DNA-binding protein n=1 Tax=Rhodanobacter lindaniclasticus TaxID=75310 RepID=A0A4V6RR89_9GAMM|nr:hypothetical protein [Rhodanobacter lindaniclasticus]THD09441.1 hypothetical protein B1991_02250 [Rhodanobacter lindaniclasticus]